MTRRAVILGCSHAAGSEMDKEFNLNDLVYGYTRSYPALIAQDLGYQVLNHSIPGGSNDAMFRIWDSINNTLTPDDLVIACWTGVNRTEVYYSNEDKWLSLAPGSSFTSTEPHNIVLQGKPVKPETLPEYEQYQQQWATYGTCEKSGRLNKIKNVLALNSAAQHQKIPVINIDSFYGIEYNYPTWINRPTGSIEFCRWCIDQGFTHTAWGHFFAKAHRAFADFVLTKIDRPEKTFLV